MEYNVKHDREQNYNHLQRLFLTRSFRFDEFFLLTLRMKRDCKRFVFFVCLYFERNKTIIDGLQ